MRPSAVLARPLGTVALFAALVLAGLVCLPRLPSDLLPRLEYPRLVVVALWENAPPQEVESLVTRRLEGALGTVGGLTGLSSISAEGSATLRLDFAWGADLTEAAAEVREKLDLVADQLPREAETPVVLAYDPAAAPALTCALTGAAEDEADSLALRKHADLVLKPRLETVPGVAAVRLVGGLTPEAQVLADAGRLFAQNLDLRQVAGRLEQANLNAPAGELLMRGLQIPVRTVGRLDTLAQVAAVPLGDGPGAPRVGEVAMVRQTHKDLTGFCRVDGRPAVLLEVIKEQGTGPVEVSGLVRQTADALAGDLPAGWRLTVVDDQAPLIERSLGQLGQMVLWGGLLAALALVLVLRRIIASLLVILAAPVSLTATAGVMQLAGVGLNLMSIGGLALGVGMLVDGSVVVLEAFERRRAAGEIPLTAARGALDEVAGGLVAAALTTAAGVLPVLVLGGLSQRLFSDMAFTLLVSLGFSLLAALYLMPALLVRLGPWMTPPRAPEGDRPGAGAYGRLAGRLAARPWPALALGAAMTAAAAWLLAGQGTALLPESPGLRFQARISLPQEAGVPRLASAADLAERAIKDTPGVASWIIRAGSDPEADLLGADPDQAHRVVVTAGLPADRPEAGLELLAALKKAFAGQPVAVESLPAGPLALARGQGADNPQLLSILGEDIDQLRRLAGEVMERLAKVPELTALSTRGADQSLQIKVRLDRDAAAGLGLTVGQVAEEVRRAVAGQVVGKLGSGDAEQDLRLRLRDAGDRPGVLEGLPIKTPDDRLVRLDQVGRLAADKGPRQILREERRRLVEVRGRVVGAAFSTGQEAALAAARQAPLPAGFRIAPGRAAAELTGSLSRLAWALALACVLVYVVLVIKFESLLWPLAVLASLPPAALGPALALKLTGQPVTMLSMMGAVVLLGLAVAGSILMADAAHRRLAEGMGPAEAVAAAAGVRARPILLSALTTMLGALPLALGWGGGGELAQPLAQTLVGGLAAALAANLVVAPAMCGLAARRRGRGA